MIPNWRNNNAAELREFLNKETGRLLIEGLKAAADGVPKGDTIEQEALNGREARGAREQINVILNAANFEEPPNADRPDVDVETNSPDQI